MPLPEKTRVVIHTKTEPDPCPFCEQAKEWLKRHGIPYTEVLHNDAGERQAFYDSLGLKGSARTVPQIICIDDVTGERYSIGGYSALPLSGLA